jgi:hypothetical protein
MTARTPRGTKHQPTHRRTLSGKLVARDAAGHPVWQEIVQPQRSEPSRHPKAEPWWLSTRVTEFPEDYRGGRSPRPARVYTDALHLRLGMARAERTERTHPTRRKQRDDRRRRRAEEARLRAAQVAFMRAEQGAA